MIYIILCLVVLCFSGCSSAKHFTTYPNGAQVYFGSIELLDREIDSSLSGSQGKIRIVASKWDGNGDHEIPLEVICVVIINENNKDTIRKQFRNVHFCEIDVHPGDYVINIFEWSSRFKQTISVYQLGEKDVVSIKAIIGYGVI